MAEKIPSDSDSLASQLAAIDYEIACSGASEDSSRRRDDIVSRMGTEDIDDSEGVVRFEDPLNPGEYITSYPDDSTVGA